MKPASPQAECDDPFEHPAFELLYVRVLRDVSDLRLDGRTRTAAARALAFLLRERLVDERVATDVLTALHRALDLPPIVRLLLLGLRDALGDHERITFWARSVADQSVRAGLVPSFVVAFEVLVELRNFDGTVPARWRLGLLHAAEVEGLARQVLRATDAYARRFPAESNPWLAKARRQSSVTLLCAASERGRVRHSAVESAALRGAGERGR